MRLIPRALDRYVFMEWAKIFVTTALGFPLLVIVIDLTDNLEKYLSRHLSREAIALSYLYWLPESMFLILPAAVLFERILGLKTLLFSFSTGDEQLHAPNEFFRLDRLEEGIRAWSALWRRLAEAPEFRVETRI